MKNKDDLLKFLANHPSPKLIPSSTIKSGYVSCINPVPTICGPEIYYNEDAKFELLETIEAWNKRGEG